MLGMGCTVYADFTASTTVPRLDNQKSLQKQLAWASAMCVVPAALTACIFRTDPHALQFTLLASLISTIACFVSMQRKIAPLEALRVDHEVAKTNLAQRTQTVDR